MMLALWVFWLAWALVAYTYVVFPLGLALVARLRGHAAAPANLPDSELPRVALVVAAYNEAANLPAKLANTWALDYPADRLELWIGSDGSDDDSSRILLAENDPRLHALVFPNRRGKQSVLADVVGCVDAPVLVLSDANSMLAPDAVRRLVAHLAHPRVGIVSGEVQLEQEGGASGEGLYWRYESWIKRNESRLGFLMGCNGGLFAIRRALFERLPADTIVEDFVLTLRVLLRGFEARFEPAARATEPSCPDARAEMVRKIRIGAGGFQAVGLTAALLHPRYGLTAAAYWGHKVLRWCAPLLVLSALFANLWLMDHPLYRAVFALVLAGIPIALQVHGMPTGRMPPRWMRVVGYLYLMNWALLLGFFRWLTGTQRVTWDRVGR
jgi:cellulose synthase/poly-beta-1,6-N-acetylglucosamine synthase-like glycosyltransferase